MKIKGQNLKQAILQQLNFSSDFEKYSRLDHKRLMSLGSQFNKNILRNFKPQFPRVIIIRKSTIEHWYKTTNNHCKEIKKYRHWFVRLGKFKKKDYRTGSLMSEWR